MMNRFFVDFGRIRSALMILTATAAVTEIVTEASFASSWILDYRA